MTLADLGHKSVRRNALITDLLHRIDFIEKAGTGIKRIRDEVRGQGCSEPEFEKIVSSRPSSGCRLRHTRGFLRPRPPRPCLQPAIQ